MADVNYTEYRVTARKRHDLREYIDLYSDPVTSRVVEQGETFTVDCVERKNIIPFNQKYLGKWYLLCKNKSTGNLFFIREINYEVKRS